MIIFLRDGIWLSKDGEIYAYRNEKGEEIKIEGNNSLTQIIDNDYIHKVDITQFDIIQIVGKSSSFLVRPEKEEVKIKGKQYTTKICILLKEVDKQTIENYEEEIPF